MKHLTRSKVLLIALAAIAANGNAQIKNDPNLEMITHLKSLQKDFAKLEARHAKQDDPELHESLGRSLFLLEASVAQYVAVPSDLLLEKIVIIAFYASQADETNMAPRALVPLIQKHRARLMRALNDLPRSPEQKTKLQVSILNIERSLKKGNG